MLIKNDENKSKRVLCPKPSCEREFSEAHQLKLHLAVDHLDGESKHKCKDCGEIFKHINSLSAHCIKMHSAPKLCCNVCKKTFIHKQSLCRHQKYTCGKNSAEKSFMCKWSGCYKKFAVERYRKQHERIHQNLK